MIGKGELRIDQDQMKKIVAYYLENEAFTSDFLPKVTGVEAGSGTSGFTIPTTFVVKIEGEPPTEE